MRKGDTDPAVANERQPSQATAHNYISVALMVGTMVATLGVNYGLSKATQSNQETMISGIRTQQLADGAKLSALDGITASLVTRLGSIENQDIPGHFSKLDSIVAALNQQMEDQQKRSDAARQERLLWQTQVSDKIDKLIASVAHMEGRQDRTGRQ